MFRPSGLVCGGIGIKFTASQVQCRPRRVNLANPHAQILFQPREGGGVVASSLWLETIGAQRRRYTNGEVMFADGCRQSFAGVRVQAFLFFQRRVIR